MPNEIIPIESAGLTVEFLDDANPPRISITNNVLAAQISEAEMGASDGIIERIFEVPPDLRGDEIGAVNAAIVELQRLGLPEVAIQSRTRCSTSVANWVSRLTIILR